MNEQFLYMNRNNANGSIFLQCLKCNWKVEKERVITRNQWNASYICITYHAVRSYTVGVIRSNGGMGFLKLSAHSTPLPIILIKNHLISPIFLTLWPIFTNCKLCLFFCDFCVSPDNHHSSTGLRHPPGV